MSENNFREAMRKKQGEETFQATLVKYSDPQSVIEYEDVDDLSDAMFEIFTTDAEFNLSLGWDGESPGASGGVYLCGYKEGPFIIYSSDFDDIGPFDTLDEALEEECFCTETPNPELSCDDLPIEKLLEIARRVIGWHEGSEIWINGEKYAVSGDALVAC